MKNRNNAPAWFRWAHKVASAPLKTKLTVIGIGLAFAAAARLAWLEDAAQAPKAPREPVLTPAPRAEITLEDNTRLLAAYAAIGAEPPPEILHQTQQLMETAKAPQP